MKPVSILTLIDWALVNNYIIYYAISSNVK